MTDTWRSVSGKLVAMS